MPITVKINPVRVEGIEIQADSQAWEDVLLSVWPIVRRHLRNLDKELGNFSAQLLVHAVIDEHRARYEASCPVTRERKNEKMDRWKESTEDCFKGIS